MTRFHITFCCVLFAALTAQAAERPNIIVIFTDDHGYADLGCQDILADITTPHIDALVKGGVRMTSGYVTAPQCVPSRAGLMSGRYQNRFGVESNGEALDGFDAQQTIAERLKRAGYTCGMTGKWHLGPQTEIVTHGFDDVYYKNADRPGWANFELDGSDREPGPEDSSMYHLDVNSAAACAFIKRHHKQPFFFYCAYRAPHVPLDAPPKYLQRFPGKMPERRRQALAMISAIDDGVGQIVAALREHQIEERTLIFFIGDNGAPLKIHKHDAPGGGPGWDGSLNDPLNGEKGMLAEGGIRVPFFAYWKGTIPGGLVYAQPVISLDVAATAVALAGLPADSALDGVNLIPHLTGATKKPPHEVLYWRWVSQAAVREGKWKYLRGGAREYLFDLEADPEEKHSVISQHPEVAVRLQTKLLAWSQEMKPPGLETQNMSPVWEQYYDFYLDGKPAPPLQPKQDTRAQDTDDKVQGWVVRNANAFVADGPLRIVPRKNAKPKPFIAQMGLQIPGPARVRLQLRTQQGGQTGFQWRLSGQHDFAADQSVTQEVNGSADWQTVETSIPANGQIIHLRVLLPGGVSEIREIQITGQNGKGTKRWTFPAK